jgi:hypothetical protein
MIAARCDTIVTRPAGTVNLAVVSTLSAAQLDVLQGDPVTLATLAFAVEPVQPGQTTLVGIALNALGDGLGRPLPISGLIGATLVGACPGPGPGPQPPQVPEPVSGALLASGLFAIFGSRLRR